MSDQEFEQSKTLDHPCKQTCSGWEQGRLRGQREVLESEEIKSIFQSVKELKRALWSENIDTQNQAYENACDYVSAFQKRFGDKK